MDPLQKLKKICAKNIAGFLEKPAVLFAMCLDVGTNIGVFFCVMALVDMSYAAPPPSTIPTLHHIIVNCSHQLLFATTAAAPATTTALAVTTTLLLPSSTTTATPVSIAVVTVPVCAALLLSNVLSILIDWCMHFTRIVALLVLWLGQPLCLSSGGGEFDWNHPLDVSWQLQPQQ
jgi:hypothetical protein